MKRSSFIILSFTAALLFSVSLAGSGFAKDEQQPDIVTLMSKDLADYPGKEATMITVEYPPGWSDPVHRHNAYAFVYVLEGTVIMQVK